jgi:hypothetical protein
MISIFNIQIFKIIGCTLETFSEKIVDKENLTYSFIKYLHENGITIWYTFTHEKRTCSIPINNTKNLYLKSKN